MTIWYTREMIKLCQYLLPQHLLSRMVGKIMQSEQPWLKTRLINWFINHYQIDLTEADIADPKAYKSFNQFFTRGLKLDARPIASGNRVIACPADGAISAIGSVREQQLIQAKKHHYSLVQLLSSSALAGQFTDGEYVTVYLSPRDYHRVHMPLSGRLLSMSYVPGCLFSVNQQSVATVPGLFARNERLICLFETEFGPMAVVLVGAMLVAGIVTTWAGKVVPRDHEYETYNYESHHVYLEKGQELGHFEYGSTVIVLLPNGIARWSAALSSGSKVSMGQALGDVISQQE